MLYMSLLFFSFFCIVLLFKNTIKRFIEKKITSWAPSLLGLWHWCIHQRPIQQCRHGKRTYTFTVHSSLNLIFWLIHILSEHSWCLLEFCWIMHLHYFGNIKNHNIYRIHRWFFYGICSLECHSKLIQSVWIIVLDLCLVRCLVEDDRWFVIQQRVLWPVGVWFWWDCFRSLAATSLKVTERCSSE